MTREEKRLLRARLARISTLADAIHSDEFLRHATNDLDVAEREAAAEFVKLADGVRSTLLCMAEGLA